jgi:alcohol dehydrogenase class IV
LAGKRRLESGVRELVLIPTTAGTGSEVTPFATLWEPEAGRKHSLDGPALRATRALVDPDLTATLPPGLTLQTAGDALTHACEALWSRRATPLSDAHAGEAIRCLREGLGLWSQDAGDPAARRSLAWGSLLAGMAIATSRTAAAHALSYRLTMAHGMPHGVAVASLLPRVLEETWPRLPAGRRARLAAGFGLGPEADLPAVLGRELAASGLVRRLEEFGVGDGDLEALVAAADVPGRLDNHAVPLDRAALRRILEAAR